jgi:Putative beta-barrel porin 2
MHSHSFKRLKPPQLTMPPIHRTIPAASFAWHPLRLSKTLLMGLLIGCSIEAKAQQVIASAPASSYILGSSPFQWGPVNLHPHLSYSYVYGDGIQAQPGQQSTTAIHTISPGILFNVGRRWTLDCTGSQIYYSDPAFRDTFDFSFNLAGATTYEDWNFQVSQTYASTSDPLIETGRQTDQKANTTALTASYRFNPRIQLDSTLNQQARSSDDSLIPDFHDWSISERLHYRLRLDLDMAMSVDWGYVDMSDGSDMTYTRPQAQLTWQSTDRITLGVTAGFENRKFRSGNQGDLNNPTLSATFQYHPFEQTTFNFGVNRGVAASYFENQVTENTGWKADIEQRLLQHFHLNVGFAQQKSSYVATSANVSAGREDRNHAFNVSLSTTVFQRLTLAVSYQNSHNSSNITGFGFNSSQIGFNLGYRF